MNGKKQQGNGKQETGKSLTGRINFKIKDITKGITKDINSKHNLNKT